MAEQVKGIEDTKPGGIDEQEYKERVKKDRVEANAKRVEKELAELKTETLEDLVMSGEVELTNRELMDDATWVDIQDIKDEIDEASKAFGQVSGISTGYPKLDQKIGGLKKGEVILIGGETNNGKSALAQNIAVNVGREHRVGFITLEMLQKEAGARLKHMNGDTIEGLKINFQTEYTIDYRHLEPLFKTAIKLGAELIILDYLQYLGRGMTLEEVAKMSKLMKQLALRYELPFIVIVSIRKGGAGQMKRAWTQIFAEDLMGTSAIAYDADISLIASRMDGDNKFDPDGFYVRVIKARAMAYDPTEILRFRWESTKIIEDPDWIPSGETKTITEEEFLKLSTGSNRKDLE